LRLTPEGNVIRGGFGGRFRRRDLNAVFVIVLVSSEPHGAAIGAAARNILERISKNRDIPRPLVIKPPMERQDNYQPGERLSFDVVFVG
jgi:hypothetical protein